MLTRIVVVGVVAGIIFSSSQTEAADAESSPRLMESAKRAAVRFAVEQSDEEPVRRRSMARTWGGVGLIVAGLVVPVGVERGIGTYKRTEYHPGGVLVAAGLVGAGVMLATVWSDVPANSVDFGVAPGRVRVGKTFGW